MPTGFWKGLPSPLESVKVSLFPPAGLDDGCVQQFDLVLGQEVKTFDTGVYPISCVLVARYPLPIHPRGVVEFKRHFGMCCRGQKRAFSPRKFEFF